MATEITVLDFKLSNTFSEYCTHMNAPEQQAMFKEMGVKTFYIGECIGDSKRATVMFEGPENVLYNIFISPKTKPIVCLLYTSPSPRDRQKSRMPSSA